MRRRGQALAPVKFNGDVPSVLRHGAALGLVPLVPAGESRPDWMICREILAIARQSYFERTGNGHPSWRKGVPFPVSPAVRKIGVMLADSLVEST
jgi:hypothetical protein